MNTINHCKARFGFAQAVAMVLAAQLSLVLAAWAGCPLPDPQGTVGIPSPVTFTVVPNNGLLGYPNGGSYMKVTIAADPAHGYPGGDYLAWCSDAAVSIAVGGTYSPATVIDSQFTSCPDAVHDISCVPAIIYKPDATFTPSACVWNQINYLINHKHGNADSVQAAIWDLISPTTDLDSTPSWDSGDRNFMVADAQLNGGNFAPGPGELRAAILYVADYVQVVFVETRVPERDCSGQIGDFVWNDLNGNGCQDANEPGISGVIVNLYQGCSADLNSVPFKTTTTDSAGKYLFTDLCAGDYTVSFVTPNGFTRTLANQSCSVGGKPSDETDSDCDCEPGQNCGICVNLPTDSSVNLTIDCGYKGMEPCLSFTKTADSTSAFNGAQMGYTYVVTNCGGTEYNNLAIIDDAGTPGFPDDDFTVASGINLLPGQSFSKHVVVTLPIPECVSNSPGTSAGTLITQVLPNGDVKVTFRQSRNLNDNVYGTPSVADGWKNGHTFGNLTGSDKAEFKFTDGNGKVVLDFYSDYISATTVSPAFPSGYASLGPNGGDGSMVLGAKSNVLYYTSTLAESLNHTPPYPSLYTVNSPAPEGSVPTWDYVDGYTVIVSHFAFGAAGFGGVTIPYVHNSPPKTGVGQISPTPCGGCITNIGSVVVVNGGNTIGATLATDDAIVCTGDPNPPPSDCLITKGTLKIDKKTIQLPLKNNGTSDILLTEVDLTWLQSANGNLVKMSLNGDFWVGVDDSPAAVTSGFNSDSSRRKIAKGQTKTLVLTFDHDASKTLSTYSGGTIKFGTCVVTFP